MTEESRSGEVAGEAVGVGQGQGAEGGLPALHGGAFDQPARGGALGRRQAFLLGPLAGVPRSLARCRARLSSMSRIASQSSLMTASSFGK